MWVDMVNELDYVGRSADKRETEKFYYSLIVKIANGTNIVLVAIKDENIIGFITGSISECAQGSSDLIAHCDNIYIKPEFRNIAIDSPRFNPFYKLVNEFEAVVKDKGAKEFMFETIMDLNRLKSWESRGYKAYQIVYRKEL
jgi:hypothetical protein